MQSSAAKGVSEPCEAETEDSPLQENGDQRDEGAEEQGDEQGHEQVAGDDHGGVGGADDAREDDDDDEGGLVEPEGVLEGRGAEQQSHSIQQR